MIRYYLSEMAVSNQHGGGLTLQGVVGPQLDQIDRFFTIGQFAVDRPAAAQFRDRCETIKFWSQDPVSRRRFGSRPLKAWDWLTKRSRIRRITSRLRQTVAQDPDGYWLICPQSSWTPMIWNGELRPLSERYISWVMDDHVIRYRKDQFEYPPSFRPLMERHLRQAAHVFVISPAMRDYYRQEFDVESTVLFGGAETVATRSVQPTTNKLGPIRLAYFGAIGPWQLDPLVSVASILPKVDATLDVYSTNIPPSAMDHPWVRYRGFLTQSEVSAAMFGYDAVVLPISFRNEHRHLTDLNIATKMSELLASGTLTLVVGPSSSAMVQFVRPHDAALIVDTPIEPDLVEKVAMCRDSAVRSRVLENAAKLVRQELLLSTMRDRWDQIVSRLGCAPSSKFGHSTAKVAR